MKYIYIILTLFLLGCSSKQTITNFTKEEIKSLEIQITNQNDAILFNIKNNTNDTLVIYQPSKLYLERFDEGNWQILKILPCPCDAPCNAPKETKKLAPNELFNLAWNKEESWCGNEKVNNVRNTIKQSVKEGAYRIKINILTKEKSINPIYKEFSII